MPYDDANKNKALFVFHKLYKQASILPRSISITLPHPIAGSRTTSHE